MKFGVSQMATTTLGGILFSLVLLTGSCDAGTCGQHNCTIKINILYCQESNTTCLVLVGVGAVVILLLIILITTCVVVTSLVAKGIRYLIKNSVIFTATSEQRDIEQNQDQRRNRGSQQANAARIQTDPQYATVDETGPSHYFELEPPEEMSGRVTKSGSASSKLHSLPELAKAQINGATYNELTGPGHCKGSAQPKSLPQPIPQYSGFSTENIPEQEKPEKPNELIPLYSMPDKSKKTKAKQKAKGKEQREIDMSRSRTVDSFFNTKSQNVPEQGADLISDEQAIIQRTPSPPPPMLPPKPGQKKVQVEEGRQNASNEESFYSEVSSKPLQDNTPGKACTQQFAPSATTTAVGTPNKSSPQIKDLDDIPRSFSTLDNVQQKGTHSRKPMDPLQK